mmetsp:Transcript_22681/g.63760  ORF Transcript_22681/g.63760 Transcript_22681/m.63760 type:complete len:208 (-) Transcript_22681:68-691(-)
MSMVLLLLIALLHETRDSPPAGNGNAGVGCKGVHDVGELLGLNRCHREFILLEELHNGHVDLGLGGLVHLVWGGGVGEHALRERAAHNVGLDVTAGPARLLPHPVLAALTRVLGSVLGKSHVLEQWVHLQFLHPAGFPLLLDARSLRVVALTLHTPFPQGKPYQGVVNSAGRPRVIEAVRWAVVVSHVVVLTEVAHYRPIAHGPLAH